ncbi:hypothetical protein [Streptomyces anandii]|uniref:XRE family transcriptional regulator n=1 Tax=Streptomyces anandii TaxID=285454 RepID=A0ABW6HAA1_9ACTN
MEPSAVPPPRPLRPGGPYGGHELRTGAGALDSDRFAAALRAAIEARDLTLETLRRRLADRGLTVGVTTLSYWRRGLRRPERPESLRVVDALEQILGLPQRSLTALLGPPRPRGNACRPEPRFADVSAVPEAVEALLAELASPSVGALRTVSQFDRTVVGARRQISAVETVQVVAAQRDGVDRMLLVGSFAPDMGARPVEFIAGQGCRLGRVRHAGAGIAAAELLFDRVLHQGETQYLSYTIRPNSNAEAHEHIAVLRLQAGHYVTRVRFDPRELPVHVRYFTAPSSSRPETGRAELTLDSHHSVHFAADGPGPGVAGIRWEWR